MTGEVTASHETLALVEQVFERQRAHMAAIGSYVTESCRLDAGFGILLGWLKPSYQEGQEIASQGFQQGATIAETCATLVATTRAEYLAADQRSYDAIRRLAADLGIEMPPFSAPPEPTLGAAATARGQEDPTPGPGVLEQAYDGFGQVKDAYGTTADVFWKTPSAVWAAPDAHPDPFSQARPSWWVQKGVDHVAENATYGWLDRHNGAPPGTSRQLLDGLQDTRFDRGFQSGRDFAGSRLGVDPGDDLMPRSAWVQQPTASTIGRAVDAPLAVAGAVTSTVSAVNEVQGTVAAGERRELVADAASRPANDDMHTWATGGRP